MKLLMCRWCADVVKLSYERRHCECGRVWGQYRADGEHADVSPEAEVLGINNRKLGAALRGQESVFDAWLFIRDTIGAHRVHWQDTKEPR